MYYAKIKGDLVQVILLYKVMGRWFVYNAASGHVLPIAQSAIIGPVLL